MSLLSLAFALIAVPLVAASIIVPTKEGLVNGFATETTLNFRGIPYAAPPVGSLRFTSPGSPKVREYVLNATDFGSTCIQPVSGGDEDCLFLNIMTPLSATNISALPVLVWFHGGSFVEGAGSQFDGTQLVERGNLIFVTINYRLGALGFLSADSILSAEGTTGNFGLQDQRQALRWLNDNIALFGGSKSNITIYGESAGAISVSTHLAAPKSAGLFTSAIMESGFFSILTLNASIEQSEPAVKVLGCSTVSGDEQVKCLRAAPASLFATIPVHLWLPTIDGFEFATQTSEYFSSGNFNKVPLLIGNNRNEMGLFECPAIADFTDDQVDAALVSNFGQETATKAIALYPRENYSQPDHRLVDVLTDYEFVCPSLAIAGWFLNASQTVHYYSFAYQVRWSTDCQQVAHTFELPFIYRDILPNSTLTSDETTLSEVMLDYWTSFANTHAPQGPIEWPEYSVSATPTNLLLNLTIALEQDYKVKECAFWNSFN